MARVSLVEDFDHFQHRHRELFVRELPVDSPNLALIELDRRPIQFKNAKTEYSMATTGNFSFAVCQQPPANPTSPAFRKQPIDR